MSRKNHVSSVDEYKFLKDKVVKTILKAQEQGPIKLSRAKRQVRKFIDKMKDIRDYHERMGWPHPEADFSGTQELRKELEVTQQAVGTKQPTLNPDGSLFQKDIGLIDAQPGFLINSKSLVKPDGTPFETPILPGSSLDPRFHSEEKIQRYLEENPD